MSEAKHTPGPWEWTNDIRTGDGRKTWSLIGKHGYGVLSCDGEANSPQDLGGDGESNAHLIVAAPDLLEASEAVVSILDAVRHTVGLGKNQIARIDKLRAAIAKAKGASTP